MPSLKPQRLFAAFEGGGAKGLVHIGALKALEARGFDFQGLAGTSAGAVIASLKAAGYHADEILDPVTGHTIFKTYWERTGQRLRPTGLFGQTGWKKIRCLCFVFGENGRALAHLIFATLLCFAVVLLLTRDVSGLHYMTAFLAVFGIAVLCLCGFIFERGGIASLRTCRDVLSTLISAKMFPGDPERVAVMSDLRNLNRPSLRVVAADITTRQLRLFSSDSPDDGDIPIADVVTTSVCIPLLFRPWQVRDRLHVDGGIVSNLPAWPFDEERALDVDALTLAFEIDDRAPRNTKPNMRRWLLDVLLTGAFGSSVLNTRAVERLTVFRLGTDLQTLDFDISADRAKAKVEEATKAAQNLIERHLIDVPAIYSDGCQQVRALVASALPTIPGALADPARTGRVRVCVALREPGFSHSFRLLHSSGFEDDADEGIILPQDGSVIGEAWGAGEAILNTPPFDAIAAPGSRRLNKLFAKDIRWILAVPIYRADGPQLEPEFVVAVDGSDVLNEDDETLESILDLLTLIVQDVFVQIATKLASK